MLRRFGTNLFFVPKPGPKDRKKIIELHAKDLNGVSKIKMHEINVLADLCAGMSASDIGMILQTFQFCIQLKSIQLDLFNCVDLVTGKLTQ